VIERGIQMVNIRSLATRTRRRLPAGVRFSPHSVLLFKDPIIHPAYLSLLERRWRDVGNPL
jgi:hypothetical protein